MDQMFKEIVLGIKTKEEDVEDTRSKLEQLADGFEKEFKKTFSKKSTEEIGSTLASSLMNSLKKVTDWFGEQLKGSWLELENMVSSSYLTDPTTRQNVFTYGMSAAESYGFEQAKSMLGVSEEDLMYMDPYQSEKFRDIMSKYSERYSELYDSGFFESMLDYQIEMQEFQQDIKLEFVEWFIENKDLIKSGMEGILTLSKITLEGLNGIFSLLGGGSVTSYSDSRINNSNITTNNSIKVDNTFNGTTSSDQSNLSNPGIMTYEQVLSILK